MRTIEITKATAADIESIISILNDAKGENLSLEEREKEGFLQGNFTEEFVSRSILTTGFFLAKDGGSIAGLCGTFVEKDVRGDNPTEAAFQFVLKNDLSLKKEDIVTYGPIVVRKDYHGRGIFNLLINRIIEELKPKYQIALSFVDDNNHKSLAVHRHYHIREAGVFIFQNKKYHAFCIDLQQLTLS